MSARGYRTIGDAVLEHVEQTAKGSSTEDGVRMLELEGVEPPERRYSAANLYLAALAIIQEKSQPTPEAPQAPVLAVGHPQTEWRTKAVRFQTCLRRVYSAAIGEPGDFAEKILAIVVEGIDAKPDELMACDVLSQYSLPAGAWVEHGGGWVKVHALSSPEAVAALCNFLAQARVDG